MRIIKHLSPCQILIEKIFSKEDLTGIEEKVLKAKCEEITVPGFRPGNAPLDKIRALVEPTPEWEKLVGVKLQEELIDSWSENFQTDLGEIVKIIDLKVKKRDPLTIECQFEYFPRVTDESLGEKYKQIKISEKQDVSAIKVTDEEVNNTISELQKRRTSLKPALTEPLDTERLAFVVLKKTEGEKEEKENSLAGRDLFQWGIGQYGKEFDELTKGMKEGEEKTINLKQLEDQDWEKLAKLVKLDEKNKKAPLELKLKVEKIFTAEVPPLDDDFAKSLGHFHNFSELAASIKKGVYLEKLNQEKNKRKDAFINSLLQVVVTLELPESIVKRSAITLKKDFEEKMNQSLSQKGQKFEQPKTSEEAEKINKIFEERASRELKLERILEAVAQKEKIVPSLTEVEAETQKILHSFPSPKEARKALGGPEGLTNRVTLALCFDKTIKYLEKVNHVCDDLDGEIEKVEKELEHDHDHHHHH